MFHLKIYISRFRYWLRFDGVAWGSKVWVDEEFVGESFDAYTPRQYDVTHQVVTSSARSRKSLTILVYADSTPIYDLRPTDHVWKGSWWYDGGGVYRHVFLERASNILRVATHGVYLPGVVVGNIRELKTKSGSGSGTSSGVRVADAD
eukprot:g13921.t1